MRPAILVLAFIGAVAAAAVPKDSIPSTSIQKGFKIPEDTPDGVYSVSYNTSGGAVHELVIGSGTFITATFIADASRKGQGAVSDNGDEFLQKRDNNVKCGGYELNHRECDIATYAMERYGEAGLAPGRNYYSKIGNTVAYMCNFGSGWVTMNRGNLKTGWYLVTSYCGLYGAGWNVDQTADHWFTVGYEWAGANFCAQGYNGGWSVGGD